jgi:hypothetical protein
LEQKEDLGQIFRTVSSIVADRVLYGFVMLLVLTGAGAANLDSLDNLNSRYLGSIFIKLHFGHFGTIKSNNWLFIFLTIAMHFKSQTKACNFKPM